MTQRLFHLLAKHQQNQHIICQMADSEVQKHGSKQPVILSTKDDKRRKYRTMFYHEYAILRGADGLQIQKYQCVDCCQRNIDIWPVPVYTCNHPYSSHP